MNRHRVVLTCAGFVAGLYTAPASAQLGGAEPEWYLRTSDGCRIFVQEYGSGRDTVVVLHGGWGAEHSYVVGAFSGLDRQFHFVFYDQRGSLRSPCADSLVSVAKHVDDLDALRAALRLERVTLAAHSMGTILAMEYLTRFPARPRGIVLLGALPPRTPVTAADSADVNRQSDSVKAFFGRSAVAAQLHANGFDRDSSTLTAKERTSAWRIRFAAVNTFHVERWRSVKGGQVFYNPAAAEAAARTMPSAYDFVPALLRHPCPVTIINGDHDYVDMGALQHAAWTAGAARARLVVLPNAGHMAWVDEPVRFRESLRAALTSAARCR
jgi:pimeloyl-ACP methyl ester carboxylesterase